MFSILKSLGFAISPDLKDIPSSFGAVQLRVQKTLSSNQEQLNTFLSDFERLFVS